MTYEEKLRAYIDHAFQELPDAEEVHDTKDALTADLLEHYAQAVNEGNEPAQAYEIALSHLGNLAEVVDALDDRPLPNPEPPEPPRLSPPSVPARQPPRRRSCTAPEQRVSQSPAARNIAAAGHPHTACTSPSSVRTASPPSAALQIWRRVL